MKNGIYYLPWIALAFASGCTSIQVEPLQERPSSICIQNNPKVQVTDFLPVLQKNLARRGIESQVYAQPPLTCEYRMTYVAYRSWDIVTYLSKAELEIFDSNNRSIAAAHYHLRGKGGVAMTKWQSTETKMLPVLDQLLKNIPVVTVAP